MHCALILVEDMHHVTGDAGNVSLGIVSQEVTKNTPRQVSFTFFLSYRLGANAIGQKTALKTL